MILAIDPGPTMSALCWINPNYTPHSFAKISNDGVIPCLHEYKWLPTDQCVIEMIDNYGMAVGADVFETCVWIGRFQQALEDTPIEGELVKRRLVKLHHCNSPRANDTNIRYALVNRFAPNGPENLGKGTKAEPGFFYGFKADIWQAYALAVYALDMCQNAHTPP